MRKNSTNQNNPLVQVDKDTYHIELWDSWPHGKILDALSDCLVAEDVDRMKVNVVGLQYLAGGVAESALREELASLHEQ